MLRRIPRYFKNCLGLHPFKKSGRGGWKISKLEAYKSEEVFRLVTSVGWNNVEGPVDPAVLEPVER